ncbi:MAG: YhbY family RNA-binding protein [Roseburia sp.]|nr:YhbY family RNA-binding protein [Anaeroplasma bactoclasticum]MCM1196609.1 YhbY family RNA-binding protein [Roseburia sp.]MCM1557244.1 YhbY family RNA-binding protein [Anaeroplasma bactoclasticum]
MLTPKQRSYLKSLAQPLKACFQIGKDGLSENLRTDLLNYLNKHELMKVSILNNSSVTPEDVKPFLSEVDVELVQKIGHILVLYKHSDNVKEPIHLPV